ncbi:MAG: signal transduction histidine kinase [Myxococcota bacterium]
MNNIEQEVGNIINFATDELNKELVDIKYLIDRVILSQEKEIKTKDIVLQIDYENNLPKKVYVDQVRLTQILSSVINKTIKILPSDSKVNICIKTITKNKHKHVAIKIEDNGIGIGIKEYLESAKKRGGYEESAVSGIDISIRTIEELVKLHGGEIFYNNKIQQGSTTTITIPYPKTQKTSKPKETAANNIVYLPLRNK